MNLRGWGGDGYPGDIFHYPRFRIAMAARAAGLDPVDGPFANFRNEEGYRREARCAHMLGFVGKWAIHPAQIAPALEIFSPSAEEVTRARELAAAYDKALAEGHRVGERERDDGRRCLDPHRHEHGRKAELIGMYPGRSRA